MGYKNIKETKKFPNSNLLKAARAVVGIKNFGNFKKYDSSIPKKVPNKTNSYSPTYVASKPKISSPKDSYGNDGVRATMNNMGIDNSKIGWQDGYVTYDGMRFKPSNVKDGTSYATTYDIQNFVNQIYKKGNKNPIRVADYNAPAGLGSVSYSNNGNISVGGESVPLLYMDGDNAVVNRGDLDRAYAKLKNNTGVKTSEEVYDSWNRKYENSLNHAYNDMADYDEWDYNPSKDSAYKEYSKLYQREGERAYRDAAAKMASKNNGNMTSAAQSLANQQLNYYMNQLADRIPELQKNAYERYKNGFDMKKQTYDELKKEAETAWNRDVANNNTAKSDYEKWVSNERQRTLNKQADLMTGLNADAKVIDNNTEKIKQAGEVRSNRQSEYDNAWKNAERRGAFNDTEGSLWEMQKNKSGAYSTPNDVKIKNDIQYFNEASIPQLDYKSRLELEAKLRELAERQRYAQDGAEQDFNYDKLLAAYKASLK